MRDSALISQASEAPVQNVQGTLGHEPAREASFKRQTGQRDAQEGCGGLPHRRDQ